MEGFQASRGCEAAFATAFMCRKETLGRLKASQAIAIGVVGIDDISPSWAAQFFAYVDFNGTTSGLDSLVDRDDKPGGIPEHRVRPFQLHGYVLRIPD